MSDMNSWPCSPKSYLNLVVKRPTANRKALVQIIKEHSDLTFLSYLSLCTKLQKDKGKSKADYSIVSICVKIKLKVA